MATTFSVENWSATAAASAPPPMVVQPMTHCTGVPSGYRRFSLISAAAFFAMDMVCISKLSRTPPQRPSMTGRIPILGYNILHRSFILNNGLISCIRGIPRRCICRFEVFIGSCRAISARPSSRLVSAPSAPAHFTTPFFSSRLAYSALSPVATMA